VSETPLNKTFDVIVAGGGVAGLLAAARLAQAHPGLRVALLEKESSLGGRLRGTSPELRSYSYGLNAISTPLFDLWDQTLRFDPEAPGLAALVDRRQGAVGILAGNRIVQTDIDAWFTAKGARTLGGYSASRQWGEVEEIVRQGAVKGRTGADDADDETEEETPAARSHPFGHYWKQTRKAPAAVVLEHFGSAFGIPDIWNAATPAIDERAAFHAGRLHCGAWEEAFKALVAGPGFAQAVTVVTGCRIAQAAFASDAWTLNTEGGTFDARVLIVAQPPWQAVTWLPKTLWPAHLLQVASKTKPVSAVVLAEQLTAPEASLPDVLIVPAERVQIIRNGATEISFQATIDYESSLQAPAVVKAVKALKRARRKLQTLYPGIVTESSHIGLTPVAWAQSPAYADRRWLSRLGRKSFHTGTLAFCGDAYGSSYDGDANLVRSLVDACAAVAAALPPPAASPAETPDRV